jgi:hypothetical protein
LYAEAPLLVKKALEYRFCRLGYSKSAQAGKILVDFLGLSFNSPQSMFGSNGWSKQALLISVVGGPEVEGLNRSGAAV